MIANPSVFLRRFIASVALFFLGASGLRGELIWDSLEITQTVSVEAKTADASFSFKNTGDVAIELTDVKTSCGCTTTGLKKRVYQPGESGQVTATLDIGDRRGVQKKTIRVYTDAASEPQILTMVTVIPEVLKVTPRFLFWKSEENQAEKVIGLKVGIDGPVNLLRAKPNTEHFSVKIETVEAGQHYRLYVTPVATGKARGIITIETDYPKTNPKTYRIFTHVR